MTDLLELTEDEFDEHYPLMPNHLNPNAGWDGCLFETYGPELDFLRQQDPATVWTLVDGDDGDLYIQSGICFVNRIGYFISTVPTPENAFFHVRITMSDPDSESASE
ncbi:hypothetical protein [Aeoliella sp.]|uniref:hypothetical protein n=1 Tax=Aeoliella sp. TaxID=2795800 RepID=UPI003CCBB0F8